MWVRFELLVVLASVFFIVDCQFCTDNEIIYTQVLNISCIDITSGEITKTIEGSEYGAERQYYFWSEAVNNHLLISYRKMNWDFYCLDLNVNSWTWNTTESGIEPWVEALYDYLTGKLYWVQHSDEDRYGWVIYVYESTASINSTLVATYSIDCYCDNSKLGSDVATLDAVNKIYYAIRYQMGVSNPEAWLVRVDLNTGDSNIIENELYNLLYNMDYNPIDKTLYTLFANISTYIWNDLVFVTSPYIATIDQETGAISMLTYLEIPPYKYRGGPLVAFDFQNMRVFILLLGANENVNFYWETYLYTYDMLTGQKLYATTFFTDSDFESNQFLYMNNY